MSAVIARKLAKCSDKSPTVLQVNCNAGSAASIYAPSDVLSGVHGVLSWTLLHQNEQGLHPLR
jgi:hypothetical protein